MRRPEEADRRADYRVITLGGAERSNKTDLFSAPTVGPFENGLSSPAEAVSLAVSQVTSCPTTREGRDGSIPAGAERPFSKQRTSPRETE